jgi:tyrosinase
MTRTRQDVWHLTRAEGDRPAALVAYERAVGLLRARDPGPGAPVNPLGWRFFAAIHGREGPNGGPDTSNPFWSNCQHGSWYFLAWHRMYLLAFEAIVQDALEDDEWALPYWYAIDPDDAGKAMLPPAFRTDTTSELYTSERSFPANGGSPLPFLPDLTQAVIGAIEIDIFSTPDGISTFGGGERSTPSFNGREVGLLEGVPHGSVHSLVGNDYDEFGQLYREGWMGSFFTAGLDPVFWLHHANIDRLWQVWLDADPSHVNPTGDTAFMNATFSFPRVGGGTISWRIGEVLDTVALGYDYESTAAPSGVSIPVVIPGGGGPGGGPDFGLGGADVPKPPSRLQVLGATLDVPLATPQAVDVALAEPADLGLAVDDEGLGAAPRRVYLRLEGITGTAAAPVYVIYLNVPEGEQPEEHPELRAGFLSTFGMVEASQKNQLHDGAGLTTVLDVTKVCAALEALGRWDPEHLRLSIVPVVGEERPPELKGAGEVRVADIRAGQIVVVAG